MDIFTAVTTYGLAAVGILVFLVTVITEMIKGVGPMKAVPTNLVVLILSIIITVVAYFAANAYFVRPFVWYELVATIIGSFVVAFIAMNGWDKLTEIWTRYKK